MYYCPYHGLSNHPCQFCNPLEQEYEKRKRLGLIKEDENDNKTRKNIKENKMNKIFENILFQTIK